MTPRISVIMPVYNNAPFLNEAIRSILSQSYRDIEFLIIDDCSTDASLEIILSYQDERVRVVQNNSKLGIACSLNKGLDLARGEYIARMDGDDISRASRFERQLSCFDANSNIGICGSWVRFFWNNRSFIGSYPIEPDCIKAYMLFSNPLAHPSVMIRVSLLNKFNLRYDENIVAAQDFEFWRRCADCFDIINLPDVLLDYRIHGKGLTARKRSISRKQLLAILSDSLLELDLDVSLEDLLFHAEVGNGSGMFTINEIIAAEEWLNNLIRVNRECKRYSEEGVLKAAAFVWFRICRNSAHLGWQIWWRYRKVSFRHMYIPRWKEIIVFWASILRAGLTPFNSAKPQGRLDIKKDVNES